MNNLPLDLSSLSWSLYATMPYAWRNAVSIELGLKFEPEVGPIPVSVPGSVQKALIDAKISDDWRYDLNSRSLEWVEHRHWVYRCKLPKEFLLKESYTLECEGLDYAGWVYLNSKLLGTFENSFIPHTFIITPNMVEDENTLNIIFKEPPRWLGQLGYTSRIKEWKPRFYYTWDWTERVVQTAITGKVYVRKNSIPSLSINSIHTSFTSAAKLGKIEMKGKIEDSLPHQGEVYKVCMELIDENNKVVGESTKEYLHSSPISLSLDNLLVDGWFPNLYGKQPIYNLRTTLSSVSGEIYWYDERIVGFKEVKWLECKGAPKGATPWICQVNGKEVFLQGINWTPISPTFSDVPFSEVKKRIDLYKEMGVNLLRVWGGAVLETNEFYDQCTKAGLMVWQELPLSSSGIDNWPPEDEVVIDEIVQIASSYITLRSHHVSLLMYSGGNELQGSLDGKKCGTGKPIDFTHPMMKKLRVVFETEDPERRFIPTSPLGPRFNASQDEYNTGVHWSVHGPWNVTGVLDERWTNYWQKDDSLLRAETGCPGAMDEEVLASYVPSMSTYPVEQSNPVWGRTSWWIESHIYTQEMGHPPHTTKEYIRWSQQRQSKALGIAASETKKRFPATGGIIIWMGHDSFPCAANTSIIDVDGNPKPAYFTLKEIFTKK